MRHLLILFFATLIFANTHKPLSVIFPKNFPPHYYFEDGKPSGFAHDVFQYVKEDLNLQIQYMPKENWTEVLAAVENNEFDIIPDMGITKEREKYVVFSEPFEIFYISLYTTVLKEYQNLNDFEGKNVAVVDRNAAISHVNNNYPKIKLQIFKTKEEAFTALISGKVEALVYPEPGVEYMVKLFGAHDRVKKIKKILEVKRAIAVKKGDEELLKKINTSLQKLKASYKYQEYFAKWHLGDLLKKYSQKELNKFIYVGIGLFLLIVVILLYILYVNIKLKFQIGETSRLQDKINDKNISLQLAQSIAKLGSWEDDLVNQTQFWSDEVYEFFGLLPNEIEASTENFAKYIHPEDRAYLLNEYTKALKEKKDFSATYRIIPKNKELMYVEARGRIFYDEQGNPTKSIGSIYDVTHRVLSKIQVEDDEFKLRFAIEGNGDGYWEWNLETNELYLSPQWKAIIGYEDNELENKFETWSDRVHPDDLDRIIELIKEHINSENDKHVNEHRMKCKDGSYKWILGRGASIQKNENGKTIRMIGTHTDITERKKTEEKLQLAASVFTYAKEAIVLTDKNNSIIDINSSFTQITGYEKNEVIGQSPKILKSGKHDSFFYKQMWDSILSEGYWHGEVWNRRKDGEIYPELLTVSTIIDAQNEIKNYVAIFSDITNQKNYQKRLEFLAHNDPLTKLPNRVLFSDRLSQAIAASKRKKEKIAIVYIDLDGFKEVNDTYGHDIGDKLLIDIANKMKNTLREVDTIARFGGDEFVVVLGEADESMDSIGTVQRLLNVVSHSIEIGGKYLSVTASAGVTFYPQENDISADYLIRQADQAMYQAKVLGKNRYYIFDSKEDKSIKKHYKDIEDIKKALDQEEFVLYYQPKVCLKDGSVAGFEALIRWDNPKKGLLSPVVFLPIIENNALSIDIGEWVIKTALDKLVELKEANILFPISVNVNAHHLQDKNFISNLTILLNKYPKDIQSSLDIEILETSILESLEETKKVISRCNELGIEFSLDDFGTGYSSLLYLRKLAIDTIKIDKSFVIDMLNSQEDRAIIEGIILLSSAFNHKVIAEGVESKEHLNALKELGCDGVQGFYIAKPMPSAKVQAWLEAWDFSNY